MKPTDALKGLGARLEGETIQGQYIIEKLVQKGGMAWLYKARHKILQEPMAIKILFPQWSDDPLVRVRFIDEAKIQFKLKHPYIVQVTDVIEEEGIIGIVQEWVDGEDLSQYIQRFDGPMPLDELWEITKPLLEALDFAHEMGVVHRDVKPSNVLLGRVGSRSIPKLADFGIAKILDELGERTTTGTTLGTMKYIAPEQIRDSKSVDHRADIYGFGVMLYRMATGSYPFTGKIESVMFKQLYEAPPRPREINPDLSPEFEEVILQCLTKHPEDRFPDCTEVIDAMQAIMPKRKRRSTKGSQLFTGVTSLHSLTPSPSDRDPSDLSSSTPSFPRRPMTTSEATSSPSQPAAHVPSIDELRDPSDLASDSLVPPPTPATPVPGPPSAGSPFGASSPFQPQGQRPQWGEFMLDVEDDYFEDDEPTVRPQPSLYSQHQEDQDPVVVEKGPQHNTTPIPILSEEQSSPRVDARPSLFDDPAPIPKEAMQENLAAQPANGSTPSLESIEPATMLEEAPSLKALQQAGAVLQQADAGPKTTPSPINPDLLASVVLDKQYESRTDLPASVSSGNLPAAGKRASAQLERSGIFKLQLGNNQLINEIEAPVSLSEEPIDIPLTEPPNSASQSLVEAPLTSEVYEEWAKQKRKRSPMIIYPLVGVGLGLLFLAAAWVYMNYLS